MYRKKKAIILAFPTWEPDKFTHNLGWFMCEWVNNIYM